MPNHLEYHHSNGSWNPEKLQVLQALLDSIFRWNDEVWCIFNIFRQTGRLDCLRIWLTTLLLSGFFLPSGPIKAQPVLPPQKTTRVDKAEQGKQQEIYRISKMARRAESDGNLKKALELWRAVHTLKKDYNSAYRGIQRALTGLNRYQEALDFLNEMYDLAQMGRLNLDPVVIYADRIEVLYLSGKEQDAEAEIEQFLKDFSGSEMAYTEIASVLFSQRKDEKAISIILEGRKECRNSFLFARDLARWYEVRMRWHEAVREYLLYLQDRPGRLNYVTGAIGDMPPESGADSIAIEVITTSLKTAKEDFGIILRRLLSSLHFKAKRYSEALKQYKQLDHLGKKPGQELLNFADLLMNESEYQLAAEAYTELITAKHLPEFTAHAKLGKGNAVLALGDVDSSRIIYNSVLVPGSPPDAVFGAYESLGKMELKYSNAPERARNMFEKALKTASKSKISKLQKDMISVLIAVTWEKEGNLERAKKELKAVLRTHRRKSAALSSAQLELTRIAFRQGELEEMHDFANALLQTDPSSHYANDALELSALLTDLKEEPDAINALGRADLAEFMNQAEMAIIILDSLVVNGGQMVVEKALWQLSRLELNRNNFESALHYLNKIITMGEKALSVDLAVFTAGKLCSDKLDNDQTAVEYFEQLLIEYPNSPLVDRARRRLKKLVRDPS